MGTLVTRCRQRADKENDDHVTEWKMLINEVYGELQSLLAEKGGRQFESTQTVTGTGAASYALPTDHAKTVRVDFVMDSAGRLRQLIQLRVQDRSRWVGLTGDAFAYELAGATIALYPKPASGTYKHMYIPQPVDISAYADATTVDLVSVDGEKFVIYGVAAIAKDKSEADLQFVLHERDAARKRLEEWAALRVFNEPPTPFQRDADFDDAVFDPADWRFRP